MQEQFTVSNRRKFFASRFEPVTFEVRLECEKLEVSARADALTLSENILRAGAVPVCRSLGLLSTANQSKVKNATALPKSHLEVDWQEPRSIVVPDSTRLKSCYLTFSHNWQVVEPIEGSQFYEVSDSFPVPESGSIGDAVHAAWSELVNTLYEHATPYLIRGGRVNAA